MSIEEIAARAKARLDAPDMRERLTELESRIEAMEQREAVYYARKTLERARIPESTWGHLDEPQQTDAQREAENFALGNDRFLTLAGPLGRGKTVSLSWLTRRIGGRYYLAQEVVQISSFDRKLWDELVALPFLALDDLGSERGNDEFDANLYALLDGRYRRNRKTGIGTNLVAAQFRARYASGPMARLHERLVTAGRWVNLPGESMRREPAQHWSETP